VSIDADPPDPVARFAPRADAYARGRPGYPAELVPLLQRHGVRHGTTIVDLGAGTGRSTEVLALTGALVVAVEPEPAMRAHATRRFAAEPRVTVVAGRAEATGLPDRSVDHAAAMQALHWFEPDAAGAELRRILRPGGHVFLVWNTRTQETPFMRDLEALIRRFAPDYDRLGHVGEVRTGRVEAFFGARGYVREMLAHRHVLDEDGVLALLGSISYLPAPGTAEHPALLEGAAALLAEHVPPVTVDYVTDVYVGAP
jgi:SAM-dependent methyltransferase